MAQTPDHGGLHFIELIKTNLQFIHGKDCLFEVLSQVKAPDQWQVSVLKTDGASPRSVVFFDSGPGLVAALAKLHRRSAEMLAAFLADNSADASAYVKRKKAEALALTKKKDEQKREAEQQQLQQKSKNGVAKGESEEAKPAVKFDVARAIISPDRQRLLMSPAGQKNGWEDGAPSRCRGWRALSPCDEDEELVSRYEDSSLRPKSIICPNYGPASAFYRVPDVRTEVSKPEAGISASAPAPAPAPPPAPVPSAAAAAALTAEAIKSLGQPQRQPQRKMERDEGKSEIAPPVVRMQAENMDPTRRLDKASVLLYISWPSYGATIVADHCELSVRALQSRVRHMLRSNGPALFGDALLGAQTPIVFAPEEVTSFVVLIKGLRVNGQVVMLGPAFGDDVEQVVAGTEVEGAIRVDVELLWKGGDLRAGAAK